MSKSLESPHSEVEDNVCTSEDGSKTCNRCQQQKSHEDFNKCGSARDGLRRACKSCTNVTHNGPDAELAREAKKRYYLKNRELVIERSAAWREANPESYSGHMRSLKTHDPELAKKRARGYTLKRKYGITLEQYDELLARQNHCCAICGRHESEFKTNLAVDHSHRSGRIRGALCTACNYRLVAKHEDAELLRKIADYVEQGTEWFVPEKKKRRRKATRKVKA